MKRLFLNVTIVFGILGLASCLKSGDTTNPQQGAILVANLCPDGPAVNIALNSTGYITNLSYGIASGYNLQTAGAYVADVFNASNNTKVFTSTITIQPNKFYSYFIIDSFAALKTAFTEDKLIKPGADSVYIRFLHFSPNAGPVNIRDSATQANLFSSRTFNDQSFLESNANFTRVKKGIYTFQLTQPANSNNLLISKKDTLQGGHIYTFLIKGLLAGADNKALGVSRMINY